MIAKKNINQKTPIITKILLVIFIIMLIAAVFLPAYFGATVDLKGIEFNYFRK